MPLLLTSAQGSEVVRLARRTLDSYVSTEERPESARWTGYLGERRGAFVTLNLRAPEGVRLRGCIGFPYPVKELGEAVVVAPRWRERPEVPGGGLWGGGPEGYHQSGHLQVN